MPGLDKVIQDGGLELVAYTANEPWENRCPHNKFRATSNLAKLDVARTSATTVGLYCDYCIKLDANRKYLIFHRSKWSGLSAMDALGLYFQSLGKFSSGHLETGN